MAKEDEKPEEGAPDAEAAADAPLPPEAGAPDPRKKKLIIAGAAAAAVVVLGGGGAYFMMKKGHAPAATEPAAEGAPAAEGEAAPAAEGAAEGEHAAPAHGGKAEYVALTPSFVVNLNDEEAMRYLQLEVEVSTTGSGAADAIKLHMPLIRNNLLMIMGQKHYHDLDTREGKEALRAEMLEEIQKVMVEQTGKPGVDAVYFTSFVMQ